jgi:predicted nucleotide-binding protein
MANDRTIFGDEDEFRSMEESEQIFRDVRQLLVDGRDRSEDDQLSMTSRWQEVIDGLDGDKADLFEGALWPLVEYESSSVADDADAASDENSDGDDSGGRYVLLVEDDSYAAQEYGDALSLSGLNVIYAYSPDDALEAIRRCGEEIFLVIVDIRMPAGDYFSQFETVGGRRTGVLLAQEILEIADSVNLIALSNSSDSLDISWFEARDNCHYCSKREYQPDRLTEYVQIYVMRNFSSVRCFVIHGHDLPLANELKTFLHEWFGFVHVTILAREKSRGMTVIEKLEDHLDKAHFVFALFTPDDLVVEPNTEKRARQNVVFEFGYALGLYGRKSGRVFFLCKNGVEVPSDLKGIIAIDITRGIASAETEIRMEMGELFSRGP